MKTDIGNSLFLLLAFGNIDDDCIYQILAFYCRPAAKHLDIALRTIRQPVVRLELTASQAPQLAHFAVARLLRVGADLIDIHALELGDRPAIKLRRGAVDLNYFSRFELDN